MSLCLKSSTSSGSVIIPRAVKRASCLICQAFLARSCADKPCASHCSFSSGIWATCSKYHFRISALVFGASFTDYRLKRMFCLYKQKTVDFHHDAPNDWDDLGRNSYFIIALSVSPTLRGDGFAPRHLSRSAFSCNLQTQILWILILTLRWYFESTTKFS